ncbi:MAG: CPBP family intramembrane metalloprotease [Candidatus Latescibacterota bacterium]|nr:MAG: CPBP family intramembrane metalloprotease [Candidatus Latescibacterota bacterium]
MADQIEHTERMLERTPGRSTAGADILIYLVVAFGLWELEELLRRVGAYPYPGLFDGGMSLILSFVLVWGLVKWRAQRWRDLGLKKPARWWTIPLWGVVVLVVSIVAQLTIVPLLARLLNVPPPDLSRYDAVTGNFGLFLICAGGSMVTGGFVEEVIYRGFMIDRLGRLFGGGKTGVRVAALACGIPFGLVHFQWGIGGMMVTAVMGSVLGIMYLVTKRNLWPLIAAHATMDFILMLQVYLGVLSP